MKILVLIDDPIIRNNFQKIATNKILKDMNFDYRFSYYENTKETENLKPINISKEYKDLMKEYSLIFSLCSQIFPKELVEKVRCINFHFGILPYACGVAPITFSIINNIPTGFTIHLMNDKIDGGDIIYQEQVENNIYDTAKDIEIKCQNKLIEYLNKNLSKLIYNDYSAYKQPEGRRYFSIKDFNNLCKIDLEEKLTGLEFINKLRALKLNESSSYCISKQNEKINISVSLKKKNKI